MGIELIGEAGFALTTDILIFSISNKESDDIRKPAEKIFNILLVRRDKEPFKGQWCLPGGFVGNDELLDAAADRVLFKETNLKGLFKEQLYTFDSINRDPRRRIISTAYMSLVDKTQLTSKLSKEASWFKIEMKENGNQTEILLQNDQQEKIILKVEKALKDKTANKYSYQILENSNLAFDHPLIIMTGLSRLKSKAQDTDIIFNMLPNHFTLGELQQVYELILNKKLLDPAFRRIIADKVIKTDEIKKSGGYRPSALFRYKP